MAIARVTEISATSPPSFEDAIRQGIERATRTLRGVTAAWINLGPPEEAWPVHYLKERL